MAMSSLKHFANSPHYARIWTTKWLSDEEREVEYVKIRESQSPLFRNLLDTFEDPLKQGRKAYGIQLDSTKRLVESRYIFKLHYKKKYFKKLWDFFFSIFV